MRAHCDTVVVVYVKSSFLFRLEERIQKLPNKATRARGKALLFTFVFVFVPTNDSQHWRFHLEILKNQPFVGPIVTIRRIF
jgi:hypothetical protein